jgi:hypothetical protein
MTVSAPEIVQRRLASFLLDPTLLRFLWTRERLKIACERDERALIAVASV